MSKKRLENIRVNKRRQVAAEARRAKRQFGAFMAVGTLACAGAGGYYNFRRYDQAADVRKAELRKVQIEFSAKAQSYSLQAALRIMREDKVGFQEAIKKLTGLDPFDSKQMEKVKQDIKKLRESGGNMLETPEILAKFGKAGLKMMEKVDPGFLIELRVAQERAGKIYFDILKWDAPVRNASVGAGFGSMAFIIPVMLYVSVRKVRSHIRIISARRDEMRLQEEKQRASKASYEMAAAKPNAFVSNDNQTKMKPVAKEVYSEFDANLDSIAEMLEDAGVAEEDAGKAASVIMATLSMDEARVAALSENKLFGKILSLDGLKEEMKTAGLSLDLIEALKKSVERQSKGREKHEENGVSEINLPKELYLTSGPWQELATMNPRGISGRDLRRIVEGFGFELKVGGNQGHLYIYDQGEAVRSTDGRQVVIIAHGDSVGKSHVRAVGKRLAFYLWKKNGN